MIPFKQSLIHHLHVCVDKPTKCEGNAVKDLKLENLLLKGRVESLEKNVTDQNHIINEQFEQKRNQKISSEEQAAEFRAELIKIKNEKSKLSTKIKALESEKSENEILKQEIGDRSKELKEAQRILASKNSEIKALYKEKEKLTLSLKKVDVDIKEVSLKYQELNSNLYKCTLCDFNGENFVNIEDSC